MPPPPKMTCNVSSAVEKPWRREELAWRARGREAGEQVFVDGAEQGTLRRQESEENLDVNTMIS